MYKLYEIFLTHNRSWSEREIFCFSVLFFGLFLVICVLLFMRKIRLSQAAATLAAVIFLAIVFASTVFTRMPNPEPSYKLELFWSWKKVFYEHSWINLQENLLNCILLFPLGFLLPMIFRKRISAPVGFLCGFLVSASIEVSQLIFRRGLFEWDDMIHNAIGCMLGCLVARLFVRRR